MTKVPAYIKTGDLGRSEKLADRAFWLPDIPDEYIELLDKLESTKDPRLLLPYLKLPKAVLPHIIDLFDRHKLKSVSRRTPSHYVSDEIIRLWVAVNQVKQRQRGISKKDATRRAAAQFRLSPAALRLALNGRHTSFRKFRAEIQRQERNCEPPPLALKR